MEVLTFFADEEFECIRFVSKSGTNPNLVFQKLNGPIIYYKKDGFNKSQSRYMKHMILKVKGKQPMYLV